MENKEDREAPSVEDDIILKHQPYRKTKKQQGKKRSWASDVKGAIIFYRYLYIANVYANTLFSLEG